MIKPILLVMVMLSMGCATVDMPVADGEVMTFKGFASNMTIHLPGVLDADGNQTPDRVVEINAHASESPLLEGVKAIAPFIAIMGSD